MSRAAGGPPMTTTRPTGPRPAARCAPAHRPVAGQRRRRSTRTPRQAVERGIAEIAITDHVDFDPTAPAYAFTTFDAARARRPRGRRTLGRRAASPSGSASRSPGTAAGPTTSPTTCAGTPTTSSSAPSTSTATRSTPPPTSPRWVDGRSLAEIVAPVLRRGRGRRPERPVRRVRPPRLRQALPRAARDAGRPRRGAGAVRPAPDAALVESGTALEINTSGLRQAPDETYPSAADRRALSGGRRPRRDRRLRRASRRRLRLGAWTTGYAAATAAGFEDLTFRRGGERVAVPVGIAPNASAGRSL